MSVQLRRHAVAAVLAAGAVLLAAPALACSGNGARMTFINGVDKGCGAELTHIDLPVVPQPPAHGKLVYNGNEVVYSANPGYFGPDQFVVGGQYERPAGEPDGLYRRRASIGRTSSWEGCPSAPKNEKTPAGEETAGVFYAERANEPLPQALQDKRGAVLLGSDRHFIPCLDTIGRKMASAACALCKDEDRHVPAFATEEISHTGLALSAMQHGAAAPCRTAALRHNGG